MDGEMQGQIVIGCCQAPKNQKAVTEKKTRVAPDLILNPGEKNMTVIPS